MLDEFFALKSFAHKSLMQEGAPLWHSLLVLSDYLKSYRHKIEIELPTHAFYQNLEQISIGEGTVIEPGAFISGPCIIGKNCLIGHGAYVRAGTLCGDDCMIGHASEVKHSILLNGVRASHFAYVGDSILGNHVNLGAGVKCANLRLDREAVWASIGDKKVATGLKKLGALVGDFSQIGCNSVLNPGTLFGKESFAYPLTNVSGWIPMRSQVDPQGIKPIEQKLLKRLLWRSNASAPI